MNSMKYLGSLLFALVAAAALTGCEVQAGIGGPGAVVVGDGTGSISIGFTVDGRDDRFACADWGVAAADILVVDDFGDIVVDEQVDCNAFIDTIDLPEGNYSAEVTLVDDFDDALSTTAKLRGLDVIAGTDLEADVDFPASSMY